MADAWSYLSGSGDAWERMYGSTGDAWARLPGPTGDAWERLIYEVSEGVGASPAQQPSADMRLREEQAVVDFIMAIVTSRILEN